MSTKFISNRHKNYEEAALSKTNEMVKRYMSILPMQS